MSYGSPFNWEEDDAQWEDPHRLTCNLCECRVRMPGHAICSYCDYVLVPASVASCVIDVERFLKKNDAFELWCVENQRTESEAVDAR